MRVTAAIAVVCLSIAGAPAAGDAQAATRRPTNIPAQSLDTALQLLAKDRDLQMIYPYEVVGELRTLGAAGELTFDEAVASLLAGTGLTYRYLDDKTVTIAPLATSGGRKGAAQGKNVPSSSDKNHPSPRERGTAGNEGLRMAQAESQASSSAGDRKTPESANEDSQDKLEEIIVTAQKQEQRAQDVPSSIVALSAKKMEDLGLTQLSDYAKITPGLQIVGASSPGLGQPVIRGISSPGDRNPLVGIYLDDVPFTTSSPRFQGTNFNFDADLADIDRIEILKGPQSTLYGASTMGGLIKYVSKKPDPTSFAASAYLAGSQVEDSDSGSQARGWVNVPIAENVALTASAFHRSEPGFVTNTYTGEDSQGDTTVKGVKSTLWFKPSDNLETTFSGFLQAIDTDGSSVVFLDPTTVRPVGDSFAHSTAIDLYTKLDYSMLANNTSLKLPFATVTNIISYSRFEQESHDDYSALRFEAPFAVMLNNKSSKRFNDELRIASNPGSLEWLIGGYYTHEDTVVGYPIRGVGTDGNFVPTSSPAYLIYEYLTTGDYKELAAFGNVTFHLNDKLEATGGVRYTSIDSSYTLLTSGRLPANDLADSVEDSSADYLASLSYKPTRNLNFYARLASAFRPGGPNVNGVPAQAAGVPAGFDADKLWNYEIGMKGSAIDGAVNFSAALYRMIWDNIQVSQTYTVVINGSPVGFSFVTNAAKAKSDGAEVSLSVRPTEGLTFGLNGAYNKARFTTPITILGVAVQPGDPLPYTPKWTGSLVADYSRPVPDKLTATAGLTYSHVGPLNSDLVGSTRTLRLSAYELLDLRAGLKWSRYSLTARVSNVTDKDAVVWTAPLVWNGAPRGGYLTRPRTFSLALGLEF